MKKRFKKIIKQVEGETELKYQPREIYSSWSADVLISSDFEVLEVKNVEVNTYDRDGEEIELDIEDNASLMELIIEDASEKALEKLESSDFDDEQEQY